MSTVRLSFIDTDIELAKSGLSIGNRVSKKNIHLISLRYSGSYDFFAGWEIQTIIKSKTGFYEYLFTENQSDTIDDLDSFRRFLLIRKISKMKELVPLVTNHDSSEWLKSIIEEAEKVFIKKSDIAIKYINGHAQDIFGDQQTDIELKYASLDFIIERLTDSDYSVFEYIRQNCDSLTTKRFYDQLIKALSRDAEKEKPLFRALFPSGHLDAVNQLGLQAVLDIWSHEYSKEDSPFRTDIDRYADELCQDAESLCKNMSVETVLNTEPVVKSVSLFLQSIRSPKANEFSEYFKKAEDLKRQYFSDRLSSVKCKLTVRNSEDWKAIGNSAPKLLALTHKINEGSGKYKSYLDEEIQFSPLADNCSADIPLDNFFTSGRQQYLSVLERFQSSVFADILNDPAAFEDYSGLVRSAVRSVLRQMSWPDDYLENDLNMLLSMLGLVSRNMDVPGLELEVLCYGPSVFLCSFMERLLYLFHRHLAKNRTYVPAEMTFSKLLRADDNDNNEPNYLLKAFGCTYIKCLAYFLSKTPDTRIGRNYRNSIAHWASGMRPDEMTPRLTSCLLWLCTDVVNSVLLHLDSIPDRSVNGE